MLKRWAIVLVAALILLPMSAIGVFLFWPSPVAFEDVIVADVSDCITAGAAQRPRDVWHGMNMELQAKVGTVQCDDNGIADLGECISLKEMDTDFRLTIEGKISTAAEKMALGEQTQAMQQILAGAEQAIDQNEVSIAYLLFDAYFEKLENGVCAPDGPQCFEEAAILGKFLFSLGHHNDARSLIEFALSQKVWADGTAAKLLDQYYLLELQSDNQFEAAKLLFRAGRQYQAQSDTRTAADRYSVFAFRVLQIGASIPIDQRYCIEVARKIGLLRSDALYTSLIPGKSIVETLEVLTLRAGVRRAQSW